MKALLIKDTLLQTKQWTVIILFFVFSISFNTGIMVTMPYLIAASMSLATFYYDERTGWSEYCAMLPISTKNYVLAKYLFCFLYLLAAAVVNITAIFISSAVLQRPLLDVPSTALLGFCAGVWLCIINIPFMLKFDFSKGRILLLVLSFGLFGVATTITTIAPELLHLFKLTSQSVLVLVVFTIPATVLSFFCSLHFARHKK